VPPAYVRHGAHDEHAAEEMATALLDLEVPPTAIVGGQNLITIGVLAALRRRGAHGRVALIGFDDIPLAELLEPAVSVIAQNPAVIGRTAAERVFLRLDGEDEPARTFVIPTELIARGSGEVPCPD
jgi:LacI family transcriptional regulator